MKTDSDETGESAVEESPPPANRCSLALPHSLLVRNSLFVAAIVILTAGILGHLAYVAARGILHDSIHKQLRMLASERTARVEAYTHRQLERATLVAGRAQLGKLLENYSEGTITPTTFRGEADQILRNTQENTLGSLEIWIADPQGHVVASSDPMHVDRSCADDPDFLAGGIEPHLGTPQWEDGDWLISVAAPIQNQQAQLLGVVMFKLKAKTLQNLLADRTGLEESGEIRIGTKHNDEVRYLFTHPDEQKPEIRLVDVPPLAYALAGNTGAKVTSYKGVEVLAAYQPVVYQPGKTQQWGLVAMMDLTEAYAPVTQLRRLMIGLQIVLVLLGVLASFLLARRITQPVLKLADAASTIAQGDLNTRVPVTSRDEVGLLATAFNQMAEELSESRDKLEDRVKQRTAELSKAQTELHSQTCILQSILDSMGDGVIVADQNGNFLHWNPAAEQIVGIGPQAVAPQEWSKLYGCYRTDGQTQYPAEDLPLARAMRGESVDRQELILRNPELAEDVWISVNARPLKSDHGDLHGGVIVLRDVTSAMQSEQELKARDEKNRAILATAHEAFIAIDESSCIVEWNGQAEETFGWSADEALGQSLPDLIIPPPLREGHLQGVERYLETGVGPVLNQRLELQALHRDGHEFPIEITISPIRKANGILFAAFLHDITEEKRAKRELQLAKEAAEAASRAKSSFLANMSHEIRTPMNAIIGMTELVLDTELTSAQREHLCMVQESADSLLSIINDILDFSKIEAGRLDLEQSVFDLRESLGDTMKSLAIRAHRKGVELAWHVEPQVPEFVIGDRYRLRQIIVNLVGNAIKFTDAGEIVVETTDEARTDKDIQLKFSVRDTGCGIPPAQQQRVFQAFEQADESTSRRYGGTGLGLAICSRLVELMGGRIWLESQEGRGSTFYFTGHFELPKEDQLPRKHIRPNGRLESLRVLIVDDNATNCQILEETLRNWRMSPTAITRSEDALPLMRAQMKAGESFDLILIDANMPGLDGFSVAEAIQRDGELGSAITMMLTSSDRRRELARCAELGVSAYLTKPVKQSELFDAIAKSLGLADVEVSQSTDSPAAEVARRIPRLKILLAEDSLVNQKLALAQLQPYGHDIQVANNGHEALSHWERQTFDLILMDVQMPELDGLSTTRMIRQREQERGAGQHVPIIAMTAHAMKGDREECLGAGMDGYISKPVRAQQLFLTIEQILNSRSVAKPQAAIAEAVNNTGTTSHAAVAADTTGDSMEILDWDRAIHQSEIGVDALREMGTIFLEETPKLLKECQDSLESGDAPSLRRAAHTIKGSAAVFAADQVAAAALRLELLAKAGHLDQAPEACSELERELDRLMPLLIRHIDQAADSKE